MKKSRAKLVCLQCKRSKRKCDKLRYTSLTIPEGFVIVHPMDRDVESA